MAASLKEFFAVMSVLLVRAASFKHSARRVRRECPQVTSAWGQKQTNAVSVFPSLYGPIEFGGKPRQACCSPRTGFAQTLKNAYPFGTRCRAGIWESGA